MQILHYGTYYYSIYRNHSFNLPLGGGEVIGGRGLARTIEE